MSAINKSVGYPLYPHDDQEGFYNIRSKEWHNKKKCKGSCHLNNAQDVVTLSWKEAKKRGADLCGHEYKELSQNNDTKPR